MTDGDPIADARVCGWARHSVSDQRASLHGKTSTRSDRRRQTPMGRDTSSFQSLVGRARCQRADTQSRHSTRYCTKVWHLGFLSLFLFVPLIRSMRRRDTLPTPQELQDLKKELETCYLYISPFVSDVLRWPLMLDGTENTKISHYNVATLLADYASK